LKIYYGWIIVFASVIITTIFGSINSTFSVFMGYIAADMGLERGELSIAYSLALLMGGVLAIFAGRISDKYGPRLLVTVTGIAIGLAFLLMSQVTALWQIYLIWGVFGSVALSCCLIPINSTIPKWFVKNRGLALSLSITGLGLGGIVWPLLSQSLIEAFEWRQAYIIIGAIAFILITVAAQFLKINPQSIGQKPFGEGTVSVSGKQTGTGDNSLSFNQALKTGRFWITGVIFFLHNFCILIVMVHIVPYAKDLGISPGAAAGVLSTFLGVTVLAKLCIGSFIDKFGSVKVLIANMTIGLIAFIMLPFTENAWSLYLFAVILGFTGGMTGLQTLLTADLFGMKNIGAILAGITFLNTVGGSIGPTFAGTIFDNTGTYMIAFITIIAFRFIIMALNFFLARSVQKSSR
jgi:MFS family permease